MTLCLRFLKHHFGTDLLVSSWLLLWSSILCTVIPVLSFFFGVEDFNTEVNDLSLFISGILFTIGSAILLHLSYDPNGMIKMMIDMANVRVENLSFIEQYFTGNALLEISWLFLIATVLLFVYPIFAVSDGDMAPTTGFLYLSGILLLTIPALLWVIALFPANAIKNEGRGSSYVHDYCFSCCKDGIDKLMFVCFGSIDFVDTYMGVDFIAMSWSVFVISIVGLLSTIILLVEYPTSYMSYLWLLNAVMFCVGSYLFCDALYPENTNSKKCWTYTCTCLCCCGRCGDQWYRDEDQDESKSQGMGNEVVDDSGVLDGSASLPGAQENRPFNQARRRPSEKTELLGYKKNSDPILDDNE